MAKRSSLQQLFSHATENLSVKQITMVAVIVSYLFLSVFLLCIFFTAVLLANV